MRTTALWAAAGTVSALLAAGACADFAGDGCTSDRECKLGRTCAEGICVDPAVAPPLADVTGAAGQEGLPPDASPLDDAAPTLAPTTGTSTPSTSESQASAPSAMDPAPAAEPAPAEPPARDTSGIEFLCVPGGSGACQNETDCPVIEDGSGKATAQQCGIECATSLVAGCAEQCILDRTTLTEPCAGCLGAFFDCILSTCLGPCVSGTAEDCAQCSRTRPVGNTCSDQWYGCSGTELNPEYVGG